MKSCVAGSINITGGGHQSCAHFLFCSAHDGREVSLAQDSRARLSRFLRSIRLYRNILLQGRPLRKMKVTACDWLL